MEPRHDDERHIIVDAIAPKESIAELAELWQAEVERRAQRVRSDAATGAPADDVFARVKPKLTQR